MPVRSRLYRTGRFLNVGALHRVERLQPMRSIWKDPVRLARVDTPSRFLVVVDRVAC